MSHSAKSVAIMINKRTPSITIAGLFFYHKMIKKTYEFDNISNRKPTCRICGNRIKLFILESCLFHSDVTLSKKPFSNNNPLRRALLKIANQRLPTIGILETVNSQREYPDAPDLVVVGLLQTNSISVSTRFHHI